MFRKKVLFPAKNHLFVYAAAFFSVGLCAGSFMMFVIYGNKLQIERSARVSMTAFNANQSKLLGQQSLALADFRKAPTVVVEPVVLAAVAPQIVVPSVKPQTAPVLATQNTRPSPAPVRSTAQVFRETPRPVLQRPASPQVVATAAVIPTSPVGEGAAAPVTLEQAGISGIDTASVRFKSGRQISVGGEFPSGEKLVSVSPGEGKIVTDRRTILLAKPAPAQ